MNGIKTMTLKKVISGGQSGADQAGLCIAKEFGFETGGWAPKNWITSEGKKQGLLQTVYCLKEHKGGYAKRTWANVKDSDATIRLAYNFDSPGERCTLNAIKQYKKPYIDIYLNNPLPPSNVVTWIAVQNIKVLNIAGNTQPKHGPNIFREVSIYLRKVFKNIV